MNKHHYGFIVIFYFPDAKIDEKHTKINEIRVDLNFDRRADG